MTNAEKVRLQTWWLEELRVITRKVMKAEDKRIERLKKKHEKELGDLRSLQDVLADLRTQYTELENERDAALERIRELEQELIAERSKKPAAPVSDENELEAYRRAERAERQAQQRAEQLMAQAHGIVAEVSAHADENAQQIGQMAEQVAAQLAALQQVVMSSKATFMDAAVAMCAIRPQE